MNTPTAIEKSPNKVEEYKSGIRHALAAMDRIQEQMDADQREIERLRDETRAILATLKSA